MEMWDSKHNGIGLASVFTVGVVAGKAVVKLDVCILDAMRRFSGWSGSHWQDQGGAKTHVTAEKAEVTCRVREISGHPSGSHFLSPSSAPHNLYIHADQG